MKIRRTNGREAYISGSLDPVMVLSTHGDRCTVRLLDGTTTSIPKAQLLQKRSNPVKLPEGTQTGAYQRLVPAWRKRTSTGVELYDPDYLMHGGAPAGTPWESSKRVVGRKKNPGGTYSSIKVGDTVTISLYHGGTKKGKVVMRGPAGWVLNLGGAHGTPGIATPENFVSMTHAKKAAPRLSWRDNPAKRRKRVLSAPRSMEEEQAKRMAVNEEMAMMDMLAAAGFDPQDASRLAAEGIGPEELAGRLRRPATAVGGLTYTHGLVRRNPAKRRKAPVKRKRNPVKISTGSPDDEMQLRLVTKPKYGYTHKRIAGDRSLEPDTIDPAWLMVGRRVLPSDRVAPHMQPYLAKPRKANPGYTQFVCTYKGHDIFFEGISYSCPTLSIWGRRTEGQVKHAISAAVGRSTGTSKQQQVAAKMQAKGWTIVQMRNNAYAYKSGDARTAKQRYKIGPASLRAEEHALDGWVAVGNSMTLTAALKELS